MSLLLPQEIQLWYVLPVIRKELALILIHEYKFTQKKTAELLGVSPAAVSQYMSDKRGTDIKLTKAMKEEIRQSANVLVEQGSSMMKELMRLLNHKLIQQVVCNYHRKQDPKIKKDCHICFPKALVMK